MPAPSKIVDSHQHVNWHRRDAKGLVADCDAHGIAYAWLLSWCLGPAEYESADYQVHLNPLIMTEGASHPGIPLSELVGARDRFPGRFHVGFCPNPLWRNAAQLLEVAYHMHGVRICGEWKYRQLFDDPRSLEIFRMAGSLRMPVVLHLDVPYLRGPSSRPEYQPLWFGGTVANLERALQACPETVFIGHAPGFWREISGDADDDPKQYPDGAVTTGGRLYRLFTTYPNLYADLSAGSGRTALARDPGHAAKFVTQFSDRLLFGRDYYEQKLHEFLQTLPLRQSVVDQIYWQNAERLVPPPTR
ncbi:MAG: amidohydrolase family protein [Verrucomicrobia bacterium]|nr:amidohydrolase family protein [Verrucomicrobiota bacterium]